MNYGAIGGMSGLQAMMAWHDGLGPIPTPDAYVTITTVDPVEFALLWDEVEEQTSKAHKRAKGRGPDRWFTHLPRVCDCAGLAHVDINTEPLNWIDIWAVTD
jgi:hypothetical protein